MQEPRQANNVAEWRDIIKRWKFEGATILPRTRRRHNCTEINNICIESVGFRFEKSTQFSAKKLSDFVAAIIESCEPIDELRNKIPAGEGFRVLSPLPEVIVFAPGMYRHLYERRHRIHPTADEAERRLFNALQRQKGYAVEIPVNPTMNRFQKHKKLC